MSKKRNQQSRTGLYMVIGLLGLALAFLGMWSEKHLSAPATTTPIVVIQSTAAPEATAEPAPTAEVVAGKYYVKITVENYGEIVAELDADIAPITVENFLKLVDQKFYDGLTFHRIISGFMIQGGDPKGNGTGGSSEKIKGEFSANGVPNNLSHTRGVLSMARSQAYDSASSQFFIMHAAAAYLDGQYAAFGQVLSGMEVVDAICAGTPVLDRNGSVAAANQPRITSIVRIDKP